MRAAILISGRGSNMKALVAASLKPNAGFDIPIVISNRPEAEGLHFAGASGIKTIVIDHQAYADREAFDAELDETLRETEVDLVCLAGFMRILTTEFVERWRDRLINIHPSLLPAFKGLKTHERALAAGVLVHGCTVHLVRPNLDTGPILVQGVVSVSQDDTADTLASRVLAIEHQCYPLALDLIASNDVSIEGDKVKIKGAQRPITTFINPLP